VDIQLDDTARGWQQKARRFADDELIPWEVEAELNEGRLPAETKARHRKLARELGFSAMDVPAVHGGLGLRMVDQTAVWEQLGRVTNALCWCFSEPQRWMFEVCTAEQIERFVRPLMDGSKGACYAITESGPGSDLDSIQTTAAKGAGGYRIDGEKWYVTSANHADFFILEARLTGGAHDGQHALFFVDIDSPGVELVAMPHFSHTFADHHPTYQFTDVQVPAKNLIGAEGDGMTWSRSWFRHERLMIAARCCGAAARLIEEATEFAKDRSVSGERLADKQLIQAMLADSVTELWAARLMTFEAADAHDRGEDLKALHARCSMVKAAICARMLRSASSVSSGWTGSGRARVKFSA
jgi:alkylation response protein AidB-like acyl-CoA dehydrogenase